jgi:multiple sugar transport system substrate-binding protein
MAMREIRFNAFDMNCVGHQSPGLWAHPRDRSWQYKDLEYWTELAGLLERGKFDGLFIADVVGVWDVTQLPVGGKNKTAVAALDAGFGWAISSGSKKKELAWEFVRWASSSEIGVKLLTTYNSGIDPTRISTLNAPEYKSFAPKVQRAAAAAFGSALVWPTVPQAPKLLDALTEQLALMLAGQSKPKAGLEAAQRAWERVLV